MITTTTTTTNAAGAMQQAHNKQQTTLGACVILALDDPAERDPALMAERIAAQKAIYLAEMEKRNAAAQTAEPNNDSTRRTYVAQYMNGKSRRFQCFTYSEAVQKAHAVSSAVADISEI